MKIAHRRETCHKIIIKSIDCYEMVGIEKKSNVRDEGLHRESEVTRDVEGYDESSRMKKSTRKGGREESGG